MSVSGARAQALLGVVDQAVSSATNFAVVLLAALSLDIVGFGEFSVAYVVYGILVAGTQAVVGNELVLTRGATGLKRTRSREAVALALVVGVGAASLVVLAAVLLPGLRGVLLALAVALPLLLVQDTVRFAAATLQRTEVALGSDLCWLVLALGGGLALRLAHDGAGAPAYVLVWALAGALAGLAALPFLGRPRPLPSLRRFARRDYLGYRFVGEFLVLRALSQGLVLVLGAIAGLAATGALRGATTLFGPLTVAILAAASFGAPLVQRAAPGRRDRMLLLIAGGCAAATAVVVLVLMALPDGLGRRLLGATWAGTREVLVPVGVQVACTGVSTAAFLALRLVAPRTTLPLRLWSAVVVLPAFLGGYALGGIAGAVWGLTAGSLVQAALGVGWYLRLRARGRGLAALSP